MKALAAVVVSVLLLAAGSEAADKNQRQGTVSTSATSTVSTTSSAIVVPGVHTPWPGKIFVSQDEWLLSDLAFTLEPTTRQLALNLAGSLARGTRGKFLVYSTNFGLTEAQLAATMAAAGHTWVVNPLVDFSLQTLLQYDAVFLAGDLADNAVLIDYVRAGGNVFVAGGTGWGGAASEAARWNTFLNAFGLEYAPEYYTETRLHPVPSTWDSPVFAGVSAFLYANGNPISETPSADASTKVFTSEYGMFGTYSSSVIPVNVEVCPTRLPLTSKSALAAAIAGSSTLDVRSIDPASLRLVGMAPRGAVYAHGAATSKTALRLGKTIVSACLGRGDGYLDLVAIFEARDLVTAINATLGRPLVDGETVSLTLTGRLKPEFGGTPIVGESLVITKR